MQQLACIPASIASSKGYSFAGFWCLSFFLSFLIGLIVALCLTDRSDYIPRYQAEAEYASSRPVFEKCCGKCGAFISEEDTYCRKCGASQLEPDPGSKAQISANISEQGEKSYNINDMPVSESGCILCPDCGTPQRADRKLCYRCGVKFTH